jgi:hypothetical protein
MTDRSNETSGALPPRPAPPRSDEATTAAPRALGDSPSAAPTDIPPDDTRTSTVRHGDAWASAARPKPVRRSGSVGWLVVIVLILAGVAASPFWAPVLAPLLPWTPRTVPAPAAANDDEATRQLGTIQRRVAGAERQLTELAQRPPALATGAPAGTDEATKRRIDALEKRLAEAEQRLAQTAQPAAADAALAPLRDAVQRQKDELASLAGRTAALEQRPAPPPGADPAVLADLQGTTAKLGATLAALEQRIVALASANASEAAASVDPALLLSLGQLRQAVQGSGPFVAEFAAVTALAGDRAELKAVLAPLAESAPQGVPSLAILRQRFDALAGSIASAGAAPAAADDWGGRVLGKLRGLVTVRRVGTAAAGDSPDATVAQAESALAGEDLAGAVAALETLHGPPMVAARDWLEAAHRRLAAEAALGKAAALVTARLATERQPVSPAATGAKP